MVLKKGDAKHDGAPYQQTQTLQEEALQRAQRSSISVKHFRHLERNRNFKLYKDTVFRVIIMDIVAFQNKNEVIDKLTLLYFGNKVFYHVSKSNIKEDPSGDGENPR